MSERTAKTIVLVTAGLMFAAIGLRRGQIADPFRFAWAAGVITLFLSLLADVAPEIAGPFAILLLMAVYWRNRGIFSANLPLGSSPAQQAAGSIATGVFSGSKPTTAGGGTK